MSQKNLTATKKSDTNNSEESSTSQVKRETPTPHQQNAEKSTTASAPVERTVTASEALIADLVKEAPARITRDIHERQVLSLLDLPEECKRLHGKKFRYRWLSNDKYLPAKLNSTIWVLCTRENSPYIKPNRFKSHGAVEQGGMLLAFSTEALAVEREKAPAERSRELVKHYTETLPDPRNKGEGFYRPDSDGIGSDTEEGLEEGRDFGVGDE